jgi:hypothetical protein
VRQAVKMMEEKPRAATGRFAGGLDHQRYEPRLLRAVVQRSRDG